MIGPGRDGLKDTDCLKSLVFGDGTYCVPSKIKYFFTFEGDNRHNLKDIIKVLFIRKHF